MVVIILKRDLISQNLNVSWASLKDSQHPLKQHEGATLVHCNETTRSGSLSCSGEQQMFVNQTPFKTLQFLEL